MGRGGWGEDREGDGPGEGMILWSYDGNVARDKASIVRRP